MNRPAILRAAVLVLAAALPICAAAVGKVSIMALFKDKAVLSVDGKRRLLKAGETSPEGVKLISADSQAAVIEIDGEQATFPLGSHIGTRFEPPAEGPAVHIWPHTDGMYRAVGSINGYPVDFLVDTGATLIAMNANEARRLGIDFRVEGVKGASSTASGIVTSYGVVLERVRVGDIELKDVPATVIDGNFPTEVLLGNSFLNRLDLRREGKALKLQKKY